MAPPEPRDLHGMVAQHPAFSRSPDAAAWLLACPVWLWNDERDRENVFLLPRFGIPEWVVDALAVPFVLFGTPFAVQGIRPLSSRERASWEKRFQKERE